MLCTLRGLPGGQSPLLGFWQPLAPAPVAFSTPGSAGSETTPDDDVIWSVSLPSDPTMATALVHQQAETVRMGRQAIAASDTALRAFPVHAPARGVEATAFALAHPDAPPSPTVTLQQHLAYLQGGEAALSFGLFGSNPWSQTVADYKAFVQQVVPLLKPTLRVETRVEAVVQACSRVGFSGDMHTAWTNGSAAHHLQLHHQVLALTLASRWALFQLLTQTCAGAAVLAAKFSLPGGAITALPAAWRYIQDVMAQSQKLVTLQQQLTHVQ